MANSINELIKDIASRKDKYEEIKDKYNAIIDNDVSKIVSLKTYTKNENKTLDIVTLLAPEKKLLLALKQMKKSEKAYDKQPNTTDIFDLESEESAEQRRKQKGQRLKILTPGQMLSRLRLL